MVSNFLSFLFHFLTVLYLENDEGRRIIQHLHTEGVITRFSKFWPGYNVPSAWVIEQQDGGSRSIINHNSLPDLSHEDFISLLGPTLAPENFGYFPPSPPPLTAVSMTRPSSSRSVRRVTSQVHLSPNIGTPAPFEW